MNEMKNWVDIGMGVNIWMVALIGMVIAVLLVAHIAKPSN